VKVTTQGHLLFQLHPLVRGTKEKDSGLLATPNTMDHLPPRSPESTKKLQEGHRKGRTKPSNLREQVDPATMRMYPTPTVGCEEGGEQSDRVELTPNGSFILRKKNKPENTFGAKLSDAMLFLEKQKMYPTPSARDWKGGSGTIVEENGKYYRVSDTTGEKWGVRLDALMEFQEKQKMFPTPTNSEHKYRLKGNSQASKCLEAQARRTGGKLNPNFVEFLMGFPMDWTKVESEESKD
tara:strand:- start:393 stop:1103 length:711 start_codon:yes stop_codon:yes gene_type:complete